MCSSLRRSVSATFFSVVVIATVAFPTHVAAQASGAHALPAVDTAVTQRGPLITYRDAVVAGAFVATTVAMAPLDRKLAQHLQTPGAQANRFIHHGATGLELFASPGAYVIGAGMYAVGRIGHYPRATELAVHTTEALVVGDVATGLLKGLAGRARPFVTGDTSARDFHFGRGFSGSKYTSFPSGHTTTAFAAAAAVTAETHEWWPKSTRVIAPVLYGGATAIGLSRMYHNKHWASDVVLGAGIGTFSGLKVVQLNHTHRANRVDRFLTGTSVGPSGTGGAALSWTLPLR
jgi:membrane-associated phospholipid phosphatase